jgi:hypothetical protein
MDMSFTNENTGYVTVADVSAGFSHILKTTNGGVNWITQFPSYFEYAVYQFFSISMKDENTGYTCGRGGYIFKTTNGGTNWDLEYKSREPFYLYNQVIQFNRITFVDTNNIYIIGNNGIILRKGNGEFLGVNEHNNNITPQKIYLGQNYPNPFNPTTSIKYSVSSIQNVKLIVYDILGKEIKTLVNEKKSPGTYEVTFDGSRLASGIYFYTLTAGDFKETKKLVLLK